LCDLDSGDVVGDLGDRAGYETIETGENCGGEEGRGYFGGFGGSGLEKELTLNGWGVDPSCIEVGDHRTYPVEY
jgi:hypothetical protein